MITDEAPSRAARGLGRSALQHSAAIFGSGAVVLYTLGVVSTVGRIRATGMDVTRIMPLIPLEAHLRNGVGIILSPTVALLVIGYLFMYVGMRGSLAAADAGHTPPTSGLLHIWDHRIYPALVVLVILWVIVGLPWPFTIELLIVILSLVTAVVLPRHLNDPWRRRRAEVYIICSVSSLVLIGFLDAYFRSDPFPRAVVATAVRDFKGPLIVSSDGLVYLGPQRPDQIYTAVASSQVNVLATVPQHHRDEPSLLNLLGIVSRR